MTPNELARHLFLCYPEYRLDHLTPRLCKHQKIIEELRELVSVSGSLLSMEEIGRSTEGRSIHLVSFGTGSRTVLTWSQMHGDESTATLALMDVLNYLAEAGKNDPWVIEMLNGVTVHIIPMLNPDGAERLERCTALGVDMNRDARALVTPEARLLRQIHKRLRPDFGFNLHDQELRSAGTSTNVTALALLAPPLDEKRTVPPVRMRAMRLAALIARSLSQFINGHLATFDDTYEPRAFGDNMQAWGTSTVLIESGHWPGDRDKAFIRKLNFVALLSAIRAIGNESFQDAEIDFYTSLPLNGQRLYDIIIRGVMFEHPSGEAFSADIGLNIEAAVNRDASALMVTPREIGDLSMFEGLETLSGNGRRLPTRTIVLDQPMPFSDLIDRLQLYRPL
jgi:hypothetical protein